MLQINRRTMTLIDFIHLKGKMPYKKQRNDTKQVNFGCIFGAIFMTLAATLDSNGYSEKDCDSFIEELNLQSEMEALREKFPLVASRTLKFFTVSKFCREQFFMTYPGLEERIKREIAFGLKHGYVRAWHGPVRHMAWLKLASFKDRYLQGADRMFSRMASEEFNICANTGIQTFETFIIFGAEQLFNRHLKEWGKAHVFQSRCFNTVHDSVDTYVYDWEEDELNSEKEILASLMTYCFSTYREPNFGIPFPAEVEIADLTKGQTYKGGDTYEPPELPIAIKNFCDKHNYNIKDFPILVPCEIGSKGTYENWDWEKMEFKKKKRVAR